jgi:hypothetical protein
LRGNEILPLFYPETMELIHNANEAEYEKVVLVKVVANHPSLLKVLK